MNVDKFKTDLADIQYLVCCRELEYHIGPIQWSYARSYPFSFIANTLQVYTAETRSALIICVA